MSQMYYTIAVVSRAAREVVSRAPLFVFAAWMLQPALVAGPVFNAQSVFCFPGGHPTDSLAASPLPQLDGSIGIHGTGACAVDVDPGAWSFVGGDEPFAQANFWGDFAGSTTALAPEVAFDLSFTTGVRGDGASFDEITWVINAFTQSAGDLSLSLIYFQQGFVGPLSSGDVSLSDVISGWPTGYVPGSTDLWQFNAFAYCSATCSGELFLDFGNRSLSLIPTAASDPGGPVIPEPSTLSLMIGGGLLLALRLRRRTARVD